MLASGGLLAAAAGVLIFELPIALELRVLAELAWWTGSGFDIVRSWRRYRSVAGFRLYADGSVDIEAPDGSCSSGAIAVATVSLTHLAWFRCHGSDGRRYAEPIARKSQDRDDWRRFRVICRHLSAC